MTRRGAALLITLMVLVIITIPVITLYQITSLEMAIAGNRRRAATAKQAAISGIQHFKALGLHAHNLIDLALDQAEVEVIGFTPIGDGEYRVIAKNISNEVFTIESEGLVRSGSRIIAVSVVLARFQTFYRED